MLNFFFKLNINIYKCKLYLVLGPQWWRRRFNLFWYFGLKVVQNEQTEDVTLGSLKL